MTSTNIQIGFGSGIKSSSKVLKPPGGGSSDIFGGNGYDTPRSGNKNHFTSNIFAQPESVANNGLTPRRGRNNDSHNRLFGEPDRSVTPAKNHLRSNVPIGGDEADRKSTISSAPSKTSVISNGQTNGKMENGGSQSHISNGNGNKESEETRHLGDDGLDNLDTRSVRSHQSTESLLLANALSEPNNNTEINQDNNEISDSKSEISVDNNNKTATNNDNDSDTVSIKVPELNVSRMQNNNIFGEGNNQTNLKSGRRNMESRNCVTGVGIESPHYSARKFGSRRDGGNPVTGEGYNGSRNGLDSNTQVPAVNGANQVINKNRVPPGGFSSGLW